MIEAKEKAKINARERDVDIDKIQVQRAIRESEEIKIKEESKKNYAKQMQSLQVENQKRIKMMKEQELRIKENEEYQKSVVSNTYFDKHDNQNLKIKERQRKFEDFSNGVTQRYLQ